MENYSPIEQVRLTVPSTDDPTLRVLTIRTWLLGLPICILSTVVLELGAYRQQLIYISSVCTDMFIFTMGKLLSRTLPDKLIKIPCTNWAFSLNPAPFNIKEHIVMSLLVSTTTNIPSFDIVSVSKIFYHKNIPAMPAYLLILSIQLVGFGFAGVFSKFLVESPRMWWPSTLISVSFYRALHEKEKRPKGMLSRYQFFFIVMIASFAYTLVPSYLFPSITGLSFVCWKWKDSILAQQLGSGYHGLGLGSIALDWMTASTFLGSPMALPIDLMLNKMAGFIAVVYILTPLFYWNNVFYARRFPIASTNLFDYDGQSYNISRILKDTALTFDEEAYRNYSRIYLSAALTYANGFKLASFSSSISHVVTYYGRLVWQQFIEAYKHEGEQDVHTTVMKQNYKSVPQWWYYSVLLVMVSLTILVCEMFQDQFQLRYWGVVLSCALIFIFLLPDAVLAATANSDITLVLLLEIVIGYLNPGKVIANITFKYFGAMGIYKAIALLTSLKLCHYMKIPPRTVFLVQVLGTLLSSSISFCMAWWMLHSIKNICHPELLPKGSPWTCPYERMQYDYGVIWGLIGPSKMYYPHGVYSGIFIFIFIGLLAPPATWFLSRKYPEKTWIKLINWPVIFGAVNAVPAASPVNYWSWFTVGVIFNFFIFRRYKEWWARYSYVLSSGLDTGAAFFTVLVTICLQLNGIFGMNWWGLELDDHCPLATCPTAPGVVVQGCPVQ